MKIYWTIHSIPELASLPRSGRRKAFRLASRDLLKNSKERLYGFLFCLVVIGIALGILTILRPMGLGTLGRITFMLLVGYVSFVIQLHYLMPKLRLYLRTHVENLKPRDERMKMNNNLENFKKWFSGILENIYPNQNAGFVILMISFPLLERYLREKSGVHEGKLNDDYYTNLRSIFPELSNIE